MLMLCRASRDQKTGKSAGAAEERAGASRCRLGVASKRSA